MTWQTDKQISVQWNRLQIDNGRRREKRAWTGVNQLSSWTDKMKKKFQVASVIAHSVFWVYNKLIPSSKSKGIFDR